MADINKFISTGQGPPLDDEEIGLFLADVFKADLILDETEKRYRQLRMLVARVYQRIMSEQENPAAWNDVRSSLVVQTISYFLAFPFAATDDQMDVFLTAEDTLYVPWKEFIQDIVITSLDKLNKKDLKIYAAQFLLQLESSKHFQEYLDDPFIDEIQNNRLEILDIYTDIQRLDSALEYFFAEAKSLEVSLELLRKVYAEEPIKRSDIFPLAPDEEDSFEKFHPQAVEWLFGYYCRSHGRANHWHKVVSISNALQDFHRGSRGEGRIKYLDIEGVLNICLENVIGNMDIAQVENTKKPITDMPWCAFVQELEQAHESFSLRQEAFNRQPPPLNVLEKAWLERLTDVAHSVHTELKVRAIIEAHSDPNKNSLSDLINFYKSRDNHVGKAITKALEGFAYPEMKTGLQRALAQPSGPTA